MKELEKFREFINEFKIGDKVTMKGGGDEMEIIDSRRMFASNMVAYTVKHRDGVVDEYDETQLSLKPTRISPEEVEDMETRADDYFSEPLKEGVWSIGTVTQIKQFLSDLKMLKNKYYNVVGSDEVFNGLDIAESGAEELMMNAPENRSDR